MNLFQRGLFTLSSGKKSKFKIDCDALTDADWECLAMMVAQMVGLFSAVEGVPTGGLKLARALKPYVEKMGPILLVDDVWTTGASMRKLRREVCLRHNVSMDEQSSFVQEAVVFARGLYPLWLAPVCRLDCALFIENEVMEPSKDDPV